MSLNIKPTSTATSRALLPLVSLGTALVLVTYVTPMATIPATAADLGAGSVARAWILSSMSVGLAAALLATGVLGDTFGRRRVYVAGLGTLGLGSLLCALAQEPLLFVAARVLRGAGGAAVLACGLALLAHAFAPGPERVHATSVWGASVGLGIASGCVLAAALDIGSGWREAYVAVAVIAIALLVPTLRGRSFGQLKAGLPCLSDKVLAERLTHLGRAGLVERREHRGFPSRSTYSLTDAGAQLRPLLIELYRTGQQLQSRGSG